MPHAGRSACPSSTCSNREGVPAARVIIGHCDMVPDRGYHRALAERGAWVQFDTIAGRQRLLPRAHSAVLHALVESGLRRADPASRTMSAWPRTSRPAADRATRTSCASFTGGSRRAACRQPGPLADHRQPGARAQRGVTGSHHQQARRSVVAAHLEQRRVDRPAAIERDRAARVEATAGRHVRRIGRLAGQDDRLASAPRIGHRHDRQQRLGIGMAWAAREPPPWVRSRRCDRGTSPRCGRRRRPPWRDRG